MLHKKYAKVRHVGQWRCGKMHQEDEKAGYDVAALSSRVLLAQYYRQSVARRPVVVRR